MRRILGLFLLTLLGSTAWLDAGATEPRWQAHKLTTGSDQRYGDHYMVALPADYDLTPDQAWPLIVSLHGAGEWGTDLARLKIRGLPAYLEEGGRLPAIVIAPQSPEGQMWHPLFVDAVLREVSKHYRVDADRIYLTGMSLGALGTWASALAYPGRFAALAPLAGGFPNDWIAYQDGRASTTPGDWLSVMARLSRLPLWIAHGSNDPVVPFAMDQHVARVLQQLGATPRLVWTQGGHDAWTATYSDTPDFYTWLLAQRRQHSYHPTVPEPAATLAGRYRSDDGRIAEVRVVRQRLSVRWQRQGEVAMEFLPIDASHFIGSYLLRFTENGHSRNLVIPGIGYFRRIGDL